MSVLEALKNLQQRQHCFYDIHPPECPGDTPKCSAEYNLADIRAVLRVAQEEIQRLQLLQPSGLQAALQELERQKQQNRVLYRQADEANTRTARVESRCKRLTKVLQAALRIRAHAYAAGFNECLELVESGVVPEKMGGEE